MGNIGGDNVPVVISNQNGKPAYLSDNADMAADYIYIGSDIPNEVSQKAKYLVDYTAYASVKANPAMLTPKYTLFSRHGHTHVDYNTNGNEIPGAAIWCQQRGIFGLPEGAS